MQLVLLGEKEKRLLSPQQVVIGDYKDTTGTMSPNAMVDPVLEIDYPHRALQNKGIVDSGCSRHMTGNKAYLAEYQDFNGDPVTFGGSKGYITGKGKVTPLFDSMLVPHQAPKGEGLEQPTEPSPTHPSTGEQPPMAASSSSHDTTQDSRDSLEGTNRSEGDQVQSSYDSPLLGDHTSEKAE
ncbi:hypothetical protein Tco_0943649, partial [Tanacetum coccineum]